MKPPIIDLSDVPVIDQHCHMFLDEARNIDSSMLIRVMSLEAYNPDFVIPEASVQEFVDNPSRVAQYGVEKRKEWEVYDRSIEAGQSSLLFVESQRAMSEFLKAENNIQSILAKRNQRAADLRSYAADLYKDARIRILILSDYRFRSTVGSPIQTKNKVVIHTVMFSALDKSSNLEEAIKAFEESLNEHVRNKGFVGMKSMIAYGGIRRGTGLDIGNPSESLVAQEFAAYKDSGGKIENHKIKNLEDFFTRRALERCITLDVPMEFHTGIGDLDVITDKCNPMLLGSLLKDENLRKAKVILLHGSYPYTAEAGWMAHFFPNVYLDASILFFTHRRAAARKVEEALEMAPYSKLLYSSDGGVLPETHWFGAISAKRSMEIALQNLIEAETVSEKEAMELGERFFHKNAEKLFRLEPLSS
ncbi:MAG TPA: amidohydrolase family protein [Nitrososphaerales archaeon]|nr:amidohydrolase family protein [Nitrososphaerales archaeon]